MAPRTVSARWDGGQSSTVDMGGLSLAIGEDAVGTGSAPAPLPTDVLLASIASCFAIALAFVAAKRDLELPGLHVEVTGDYDGPRMSTVEISVRSDADPELVRHLIPRAERVCYVTNTLRRPPQITVRQEQPEDRR